MKTKEEIEQLAEQDFNDRQECGHYELADLKSIDYYYDGFTNGYTQCQEDMAKRITDLENILHTICVWCNPHDSSHENIWRIAHKSLNKQD